MKDKTTRYKEKRKLCKIFRVIIHTYTKTQNKIKGNEGTREENQPSNY